MLSEGGLAVRRAGIVFAQLEWHAHHSGCAFLDRRAAHTPPESPETSGSLDRPLDRDDSPWLIAGTRCESQDTLRFLIFLRLHSATAMTSSCPGAVLLPRQQAVELIPTRLRAPNVFHYDRIIIDPAIVKRCRLLDD